MDTAKRFWAKVDIRSDDECWEWRGAGNPGDYGRFKLNGSTINASRAAYIITNGPVDPGILIRHTCDNPPCCNPNHLIPGTRLDNRQDAVSRNRQTKGESFPQAKLTDDAVKEIRSRYVRWSRQNGAYALAREFDVSESLVRRVVTDKAWRHVA